jgi:hypothetical protein
LNTNTGVCNGDEGLLEKWHKESKVVPKYGSIVIKTQDPNVNKILLSKT